MREKIKNCLSEKYSVSREITKVYEGDRLVAINSTLELRIRRQGSESDPQSLTTETADMPSLVKLILSLLGGLIFHILNKVNKE